MHALITELERLPGFAEVGDDLSPGVRRVGGLVGSAKAVLAASLFGRQRRTILVVVPSTRAAEAWYDDLHALVRTGVDDLAPPLRLFPSLPTLLYADEATDRQLVGQRLDALEALLRGEPTIVVAPLSAVLHRSIPPSALAGSDLSVEVGQAVEPEALLTRLEELGYVRHDPVVMPGQCCRRGGILDVYPMTAPQPLRVEFWGDEIESIRYFEVNSQRSTLPQPRFTVTVSRESIRTRALDARVVAEIHRAAEQQAEQLAASGRQLEASRLRGKVAHDLRKLEAEEPFDGSDHYLPYLYDDVATVLDYLPPGAVVLVDEPEAVAERAEALADEVEAIYRDKLAAGAVLALPSPLYRRHDPARPLWYALPALELTAGAGEATFELADVGAFDGDLETAVEAVRDWQREGYRLLCTTHQVGRLRQILHGRGVAAAYEEGVTAAPDPGRIRIVDQRLSAGFLAPSLKLGVVTDHEVFGWHRARTRAGRSVARRGSTALANLTELSPGDTVVHIYYGIGVFKGMITRAVAGVERDYLQIDYAGTDRLYVPVTELDRVQRYLGPEGAEPALNSLSDNRWRSQMVAGWRSRKSARLPINTNSVARLNVPATAVPTRYGTNNHDHDPCSAGSSSCFLNLPFTSLFTTLSPHYRFFCQIVDRVNYFTRLFTHSTIPALTTYLKICFTSGYFLRD